jgi:hypothetical protein
MATEIGGYRQYKKETATDTTLTIDIGPVPEGHKVYWTRASGRTSKLNADAEYAIVSGGQEFIVQQHVNHTADVAYGQLVNTWVYAGEFFRVNWVDIAAADVLEFWVVGEDKYEVDSG